jgi:hypothetical protein
MEDIEAAGVEQAIGRLADHFPEVAVDEIATLVHAEHERFAGHPVRDYIPVLIEHAVRNELRERSLVTSS